MQTKYLFLSILLWVCFASAHGQEYHSLPDSNATWIICQADFPPGYWYSKFSLSSYLDDTLINNKLYNKLYYQYSWPPAFYCGAFRNETDAISYFVPPNSEQEYLLRDFTKHTGDTIRDVICHEEDPHDFMFLDLVVDTVEYKSQGPYITKVMYLSDIDDTIPSLFFDGDHITWMERVGSKGAGILNAFVDEQSFRQLRCMQYNDTIFYNEYQELLYTQGECAYPLGVEENTNINNQIHTQPNPFRDQLTLSNLPVHTPLTIKLTNIYGQTVFTKVLYESLSEYVLHINSNLPKGMYLISIMAHNKIITTTKVEKE